MMSDNGPHKDFQEAWNEYHARMSQNIAPTDSAEDLPGAQTHKKDMGKPRLDLIPGAPIEWIGWVLLYGIQKYGYESEGFEQHWREVENYRLYGSVMRHLMAYAAGEQKDPESNLPHLAHALTTLMQLVDVELGRADASRTLSTISCAIERLRSNI